jgi:2-iminobutanoate/2-iminopropanoate deaminase
MRALWLGWAAVCLAALPAAAGKRVITPDGVSRSGSPLSAAIETKDLVYVSGMTGRDAKGGYARGDIEAQTVQTLANIGAALKAAGLGFSHVLSTTVYVRDIRWMPQVDEVYRRHFPGEYPARTVLESMLMSPDALVEISAIAARDPSTKRIIRPEGWPEPPQPESYAVAGGGTLFLSALHPTEPRMGALAGDTITTQVEQVMRNQEAILKAAGLSFADLVFSRIYLSDPSLYTGLNDAYRKFVTAPPPARATVHAFPVAPGRLLQIQSVAVPGAGAGRPSGEGHTSPIHSFSVKAGNRLYITGMTGRAKDGAFARGDIRAQTREALNSIGEQLDKHGFTFADVVDSVVRLRDARDFAGMNEVYRQVVRPDPPARATVRIPPSSAGALVEIMMVAEK